MSEKHFDVDVSITLRGLRPPETTMERIQEAETQARLDHLSAELARWIRNQLNSEPLTHERLSSILLRLREGER